MRKLFAILRKRFRLWFVMNAVLVLSISLLLIFPIASRLSEEGNIHSNSFFFLYFIGFVAAFSLLGITTYCNARTSSPSSFSNFVLNIFSFSAAVIVAIYFLYYCMSHLLDLCTYSKSALNIKIMLHNNFMFCVIVVIYKYYRERQDRLSLPSKSLNHISEFQTSVKHYFFRSLLFSFNGSVCSVLVTSLISIPGADHYEFSFFSVFTTFIIVLLVLLIIEFSCIDMVKLLICQPCVNFSQACHVIAKSHSNKGRYSIQHNLYGQSLDNLHVHDDLYHYHLDVLRCSLFDLKPEFLLNDPNSVQFKLYELDKKFSYPNCIRGLFDLYQSFHKINQQLSGHFSSPALTDFSNTYEFDKIFKYSEIDLKLNEKTVITAEKCEYLNVLIWLCYHSLASVNSPDVIQPCRLCLNDHHSSTQPQANYLELNAIDEIMLYICSHHLCHVIHQKLRDGLDVMKLVRVDEDVQVAVIIENELKKIDDDDEGSDDDVLQKKKENKKKKIDDNDYNWLVTTYQFIANSLYIFLIHVLFQISSRVSLSHHWVKACQLQRTFNKDRLRLAQTQLAVIENAIIGREFGLLTRFEIDLALVALQVIRKLKGQHCKKLDCYKSIVLESCTKVIDDCDALINIGNQVKARWKGGNDLLLEELCGLEKLRSACKDAALFD